MVTGAAGGIGEAVAQAVAEAGGRVVAVDLTGTLVTDVVTSLPGYGHLALETNLSDVASHASIFEQAAEVGPLRGMLHAAAVLRRTDSVDDVSEADFDLQVDVNLKATFFLNRACWRALRARGAGGSIVNFASQGWWTGGYGGSVVYSASKGGVVSLTRGLARAFAPDGVRVNALAPGMVDTAMMRSGIDDGTHQTLVDMVPLGRLGKPAEMSGAALFMLSDASAYVTGAVINVSGGQLMY